jgi:hypothetical protein
MPEARFNNLTGKRHRRLAAYARVRLEKAPGHGFFLKILRRNILLGGGDLQRI